MNIYELKRYDLYPYLIKEHKCKIGIEIGVREGYHANNLLEKTDMFLYGVDIWNHSNAIKVFSQYPNKSKFILQRSEIIVNEFEDNYFDFIHIDADHHYPNVKQDLNIWYPKLKIGGIFSGDDYMILWNPDEGTFGIVDAIEEFIIDKNIEFNLSGFGPIPKNQRYKVAKEIGYKIECNLILNRSEHFKTDPRLLIGRQKYDNIEPIQWWFIKKE